MFASITISSDEVLDGTGGDEGISTWTTAWKDEDIGDWFGRQVRGVGYYFDITRACRVLILEIDADGGNLKASANEHCGCGCVSESVAVEWVGKRCDDGMAMQQSVLVPSYGVTNSISSVPSAIRMSAEGILVLEGWLSKRRL